MESMKQPRTGASSPDYELVRPQIGLQVLAPSPPVLQEKQKAAFTCTL